MKYNFKQGQIIPKRLGAKFVCVPNKHRHQIVFGCDVSVEVTAERLTISALSEGSIIFIKSRGITRVMNNGTKKRGHLSLKNISIDGSLVGNSQVTGIQVGDAKFTLQDNSIKLRHFRKT